MSYEKFLNDLPPIEDWGERIYTRPEFHYPEELNAVEELLDRNVAEGRGARPAIYYKDLVISYGELLATVNKMGNALKMLGIQPGDRGLPDLVAADDRVVRAAAPRLHQPHHPARGPRSRTGLVLVGRNGRAAEPDRAERAQACLLVMPGAGAQAGLPADGVEHLAGLPLELRGDLGQ